jgi:hypothetical protein
MGMLSCVEWLRRDGLGGVVRTGHRHCERSEAIHSFFTQQDGLPRRFAPRNDVDRSEHALLFSRRDAPGVLQVNLALQSEGAGKTGCAPHPRSRVQCASKNTHTSIQVWRKPPAFPAQRLYGLYEFAPVTGFLATVISGKVCFPRNLTPAPGRQAHTTSPYARGHTRLCGLRVHRIPSRVCDDRETPSEWNGTTTVYC